MTVTSHVTVLAPPSPTMSHCVIPVTGTAELEVPPVGQTADPVHEMIVTMVAEPVGSSGVAALYVKLLVTVIAQAMVSPPTLPVLLHWLSATTAALAGLPAPEEITNPSAMARQATKPGAIMRDLLRKWEERAVIRVTPVVKSNGPTRSGTPVKSACSKSPARRHGQGHSLVP